MQYDMIWIVIDFLRCKKILLASSQAPMRPCGWLRGRHNELGARCSLLAAPPAPVSDERPCVDLGRGEKEVDDKARE